MNIMNKKEFNKELAKAENAESKMSIACGSLACMFESYFDGEIDVLHQMGDGFVILYNMEGSGLHDNLNEPVKNAFENIKKDKDYYKE